MPLLSEDQEVGSWDLAKELMRSTIRGSAKQSRAWMATWLATSLVVTALLAVEGAPILAYVIPLAVVVLAATTATPS